MRIVKHQPGRRGDSSLRNAARLGALAALAIAAAPTQSALAQSSPRETVRPDIAPAPAVPQLGERPEIEATPRPELSPEAAAITFTLNTLAVTGSTVYDATEFESLYQEFLGTEITLETLRDIADRIEAKYRGDDYVATRALVPAQRIKDGAVEISVVEGTIRNIIVRGDIGPSDKLVRRYLAKLRTGKPLRWPEAERYLLLARDVPGLSLTGTLRKTPGVEAGGVDLIVDVAHKQFEGFLNTQNYSAESTGPWTLSGGAAMNNPFGLGDQLQGVALVTIPDFKEQYVAQINYQARFGSEGLANYSTLSYSLTNADIDPIDTEETAIVFDTRMEYPVFRSRGLNMWAIAGFEYVDQETTGDVPSEDHIRTAYARARWAIEAPLRTIFTGEADLRLGLDIFDATGDDPSERKSNPDASGEFMLARVDMSTTTPLVEGFSLYLRGMGQIADSPLLSYEQLSLGNLTLGRAFEPGDVTGDEGVAGTVELRLNRREFTNEWVDETQFYAFADGGYIWNSGENAIVDEANINSIGGGIRIRVQETILGELTYAHPTSGGAVFPGDKDPEDTVLLRLTKLF